MDELEWLKEHSPSTQPSRDTVRRHRTQLRAAIASESAEGIRPRRVRRERRSRHRVLVTTTAVVAACALGAGIVALATTGGDDRAEVAASGPSDTTSAAPTPACAGAPPAQLAVPAGFGNAVAAPAEHASAAPARTQSVTSWVSGSTTIEQRWPADANKVPERLGRLAAGEMSSVADGHAIDDGNGLAHRTIVFVFGGQAPGCETLQVTVYGDEKAVETVTDALIAAPFPSSEPLVSTTATAAAVESTPPVVACRGPQVQPVVPAAAVPVVATIGGRVDGDGFAQPADALAHFLPEMKTLAQHGYRELRLPDSSIVYVKDVAGNVVTTVHVVTTKAGWTVADWQASGC
jgi:hypothetical protein